MARHGYSILAAFAAMICTQACADVIVSNHATANMSCSAGVCSPTAAKAFLNVSDVASMLGSGNLTIKSDAAALNIHIADAITWANANTLTLDAYQNVAIRAPIVVEGTGNISLATGDGGSGDYVLGDKGRVIFRDAASSLSINGQSYVLVDSVSALAAAVSAGYTSNIALMADYDASADGTYTEIPVNQLFAGTFTGLGNSINGLTVAVNDTNRGFCAALFQTNGGTMRNFAMRKAHISLIGPDFQHIQAAILTCDNVHTISNVSVSGGVSVQGSTAEAGGLAGENSGTIAQSGAEATITGNIAGGIASYNSGTVEQSFAAGRVLAVGEHPIQGGLVGENGSTITLSHASTDLAHLGAKADATVGGLVGANYKGSISLSYATGPSAGGRQSPVGGLVGYNYHGSITQSYALGKAVGGLHRTAAGGLVGTNHAGTISQVYSTGAVSTRTGEGYRGGLLGHDVAHPGHNASAYWDTDTSGIADPSRGAGYPLSDPGITGLSDTALRSGLPAGFDPAAWGSDPGINGGLPYLLALPPS